MSYRYILKGSRWFFVGIVRILPQACTHAGRLRTKATVDGKSPARRRIYYTAIFVRFGI